MDHLPTLFPSDCSSTLLFTYPRKTHHHVADPHAGKDGVAFPKRDLSAGDISSTCNMYPPLRGRDADRTTFEELQNLCGNISLVPFVEISLQEKSLLQLGSRAGNINSFILVSKKQANF
jgi:hypothetical protein